MYNINEKPTIMKNFLRLLSLLALITFTQCCPDKTLHETPPDVSPDYFEGIVTLLAEGKNDIGQILLDFGNDEMRYVMYKGIEPVLRGDVVYFKIRLDCGIPIAHSISKNLPSGAKVDMNIKHRLKLKLDYHGQFSHGGSIQNAHKRIHMIKGNTLVYNGNTGISSFTAVISINNGPQQDMDFLINGQLDQTTYPVDQNIEAYYYPINGDNVEPILCELDTEHFHRN